MKEEIIYVVRQTQEEQGYDRFAFVAYRSRKDAEACAKEYNDLYAKEGQLYEVDQIKLK